MVAVNVSSPAWMLARRGVAKVACTKAFQRRPSRFAGVDRAHVVPATSASTPAAFVALGVVSAAVAVAAASPSSPSLPTSESDDDADEEEDDHDVSDDDDDEVEDADDRGGGGTGGVRNVRPPREDAGDQGWRDCSAAVDASGACCTPGTETTVAART